jgi:2-keto-4-pentenoate hydratase
MTLHASQIAVAAAELHEASRRRSPIAPMIERFAGLDVAGAYAIQRVNLARHLARGASVRGHKIGLTSAPMQKLLGLSEPDFGYILDDMILADQARVPTDVFCTPGVEPEIAFLLHSPLGGPGVTIADVLAATEAVAPALEIIDSRIVDWRITLEDTIADNASAGAVVLGPWTALADAPALAEVAADLLVNGEVVDKGSGSAVMGNPAIAVAWLANALAAFDTTIEAGQFVMSGSFTTAAFVHRGDDAAAHFTGLGSVGTTFT